MVLGFWSWGFTGFFKPKTKDQRPITIVYLIDGNNVMGQRVGWHRDKAAARDLLLQELARFGQRKKARVAVVFDGQPAVHIADGSSFRSVKVYYARSGSDADSRILEFVERERNRKALTVVTSDLQLLSRVRACGVRVLRAGEFRRLLEEVGETTDESTPQVRTEEVGQWMRYFGVDESDDE